MEDDVKYLTDEEMRAGKAGLWLAPFVFVTAYTVLQDASENAGVDMSETDNIDTPTQAPG